MANRFDTELLVTAAKLYHLNGLKQEEIAARLKMSRAMVSLMLTEARRLGIVEVHVRDPQLEHTDFGKEIRQRFSLDRCVVIPTSSQDPEVLRELVSLRTVRLFSEQVEDGDTIGISWGRSCHAFMTLFHTDRKPRATSVVPLVGMSNKNLSRYQLNEMVRKFAATFGANPHFVHAPALAPSRRDYELYMQSSDMQHICESWDQVDLAVVAVGAPPIHEEFDGSEVADSHQKHHQNLSDYLLLPVGNLSARYFNIEGVFLDDDEVNRRTIAIPPESMRKIPKVITMATGLDRVCSVIGALKTGIVKTLVTDETTARAVLGLLHNERSTAIGDMVHSLYEGVAV